MIKSCFAICMLSFVLYACNGSQTREKVEKEAYQINKNALFAKEVKEPAMFLTVNGISKKNIIGQTVVKGTLTNKASIATYKDVDLKLSFFSRTKTLLETDKETIYLILDPGESRGFKTKYFAPKGTDSVALQVLGAKIIDQ
ncbi:MAG: hypothetical protein ABI359_00405 [Ginsengibacter sp.]